MTAEKRVLQDTGCSISSAHLCTCCIQPPNDYTAQTTPCVWPILAVPMSEEGHLPDKIMIIINKVITTTIQNNLYNEYKSKIMRVIAHVRKIDTIVNNIYEPAHL